jgi:hypothetical protein
MSTSRLDEESIKTCSGQFDLESVFKLSMCRMGLRRIENLDSVPNLTLLDLSHNRISAVEGLSGLEHLKRLSLVDNEIEHLTTLEVMPSLEALQLQGNRLASVDEVQCLAALPSLRTLTLQDCSDADGGSNPMCAHPAYRVTVRRLLPGLRLLDDEHTAIAEAAAAAAEAAGKGEPLEALVAAVDPEPWFSEADLAPAALAGGDGADAAVDGASELQAALTDSKRLAVRAQGLISDFKAARPPTKAS